MVNLKKLREAHKLSQQKLADAVDSTQPAIHQYENGQFEPDIFMMKKLAGYLNTSVDYLIGNTSFPYRVDKLNPCELTEVELNFIIKLRTVEDELRKALEDILDVYISKDE